MIIVAGMTMFLNMFNPGTEHDPKEWSNKPKVSKKVEFLFRLLNKKEKPSEK